MRLSAEQCIQRVAATARTLKASAWCVVSWGRDRQHLIQSATNHHATLCPTRRPNRQDEHAGDIEEAEDDGESSSHSHSNGNSNGNEPPPPSQEDEERGLQSSPQGPTALSPSPTTQRRSWVAEAYHLKLFRYDPNAPPSASSPPVAGSSRVSFAGSPAGLASAASTRFEGAGGGAGDGGEEEEEEEEDEEGSDDDETTALERDGSTDGETLGAVDSIPSVVTTATPSQPPTRAAAAAARGVRFGRLFRWFSGGGETGGAGTTSSGDVFSSYSSSASMAR
jgi:hypothetical protein